MILGYLVDMLVPLPTALPWSRRFHWECNTVLGRGLCDSSLQVALRGPAFLCPPRGDPCDCQWRQLHSSPGGHASLGEQPLNQKALQKGWLSPATNSRLPLSCPSWGAAAAGSPSTVPPDRAHLYWVQLSSVTLKMMAESSGSDPDLLMQFIMNFWRGRQGIVCVLTEITRLSLSILFFFFPLLHLNGKGMSNIAKPMSKEVKYKTQCFQVGHMTLCLYSIRFWLFDFGIVSGKYTVHIYFHR